VENPADTSSIKKLVDKSKDKNTVNRWKPKKDGK
jgi:hypothetical protein